MGTWGVGVFDSDLALDVRNDVVATHRDDADVARATTALLDHWSEALRDPDDRAVVALALAEAQWDLGRLDPRVLQLARSMLNDGSALRPFVNHELEPARRKEIARLTNKLTKRPPAPKRIAAKPPKIDTELEVGDVLRWKIPSGDVLLWVFGRNQQESGLVPLMEMLDWIGDPGDPLPKLDTLRALERRTAVAPVVGHGNVWFLALGLIRAADFECQYSIVAKQFRRHGFVPSRASEHALGASVVTRHGRSASLDLSLSKFAAQMRSAKPR
jgi:hypothetical protein